MLLGETSSTICCCIVNSNGMFQPLVNTIFLPTYDGQISLPLPYWLKIWLKYIPCTLFWLGIGNYLCTCLTGRANLGIEPCLCVQFFACEVCYIVVLFIDLLGAEYFVNTLRGITLLYQIREKILQVFIGSNSLKLKNSSH